MITIWEYQSQVLQKVNRHRKLIDNIADIKFSPINDKEGIIKASPLFFKDRSTFNAFEEIRIDENGEIIRPRYTYEYSTPDGYYFRYDCDPEHYKPIVHDMCHLHVSRPFPRYITHATNFNEIFEFVIACFYDDQAKTLSG